MRMRGWSAEACSCGPARAVPTRPPARSAAERARCERDYGQPVRIWVDNQPGERRDADGVNRWFQPLLAGGGYTTDWAEDTRGTGRRTLAFGNVMPFPAEGQLQAAQGKSHTATDADAPTAAGHQRTTQRRVGKEEG